MKKAKYKSVPRKNITDWLDIANLFAKSMCPYKTVLREFNALDDKQRVEIQKQVRKYDEIRRTKISEDMRDTWEIGVMVDANIIANEYGIDPLTVIACIKPPCRPNERILVSI